MRAVLRAVASADIDAAVDYYLAEAGTEVARNFIDDLQHEIGHLMRHPLTGSLRFAYELELPALRTWSLQNFPYLIFYEPTDDTIDIWRVLHNRRDIPALLT